MTQIIASKLRQERDQHAYFVATSEGRSQRLTAPQDGNAYGELRQLRPKTPSDLSIGVYTSPARPFTSSAAPEGPGDDATWSPSSATLIFGDHDAILVDTLATYGQVDALADWIDSKGKQLSRIYITHGHGDHWLGLARLIQRFPGAKGLATAAVLARAEFEATDPGIARYWASIFPGEVPADAEKVLPELLAADTIDLEGNDLRVIGIGSSQPSLSLATRKSKMTTIRKSSQSPSST